MKKIIALFSVMCVAGSAMAFSASIFGKWQYTVEQNGFKSTLSMNIEEAKTAFGVKCELNGEVLEASVDVPTKVEGDKFIIGGTAQKTAGKIGDIDCNLNVSPESLTFTVTDGELVIVREEGNTTYTRVQ